jgi:hypothetical protein
MSLFTTRVLILSSITALLVQPASAQQRSAASIVEQFYPKSLIEPAEIAGREQCFAVYETEASGAPRTIVAAYTNHSDAVIRVLRANAGRFEVVAEPQGLDLSGGVCDIELDDINADGRKEVRVDFSVNRDTVSWLFRWDGQQLRSLTPTVGTAATGNQMSRFVNGDLVDTDNDGIKEIYVRPESRSPNEPVLPPVLYRLRGEQYVEDRLLVGMWSFERKTSTPETTVVPFALPDGARGPYTLRVVSGRPDGTSRAKGAYVWINKREILSPANLDTAVAERPITLQRENTLAVRFAGQPSEMLIIIKSERWAPR